MSLSDNSEGLPAELIADILSHLEIHDLIRLSNVSRTLRIVLSDANLNPWRAPLLRLLDRQTAPSVLANISDSVNVFPSANWTIILSRSDPRFLLYECVIPHLAENEWQTAFETRFLPSWKKWKKEDMKWREAFLRTLALVSHRLESHCKVNQAWTKYIVLNRNGSANELDASSRDLDMFRTYDSLRFQANLARVETTTRVILQLPDVRIVAIGTREAPRSSYAVNRIAYHFCHPPKPEASRMDQLHFEALSLPCFTYPWRSLYALGDEVNPNDWRHGLVWVGPMMIVAELSYPCSEEVARNMPTSDSQSGSQRYVSFTWADLEAVAPWMRECISRFVDGPGLGID